jgi:UDP-N-acetylmuramoyl-L-alanyl-D-glutamate--2,6-diaminopimelate ligase
MKLGEIIKKITNADVKGSVDVDVRDLAYDSRRVSSGACFVAIKGEALDGHDFIGDAIENGAVAVIAEGDVRVPAGVTLVNVKNSHLAMAEASSAFFNEPSEGMRVIGVTGTNGKTTITYLVESVLKGSGHEVGVIGTVNWRYKDKNVTASHTTPVSYELQKFLAEMKKDGVQDVIMEVSSHALDQGRVECVAFDAAVFTNLTQDHLDYHRSVDKYFEAKKSFFVKYLAASPKKNKVMVVNLDDDYGKRLAQDIRGLPADVVTYGFVKSADVRAEKVEASVDGSVVKVSTPWGALEYNSKLRGKFNVENVLAVVAVLGAMNIPLSAIKKGIESVSNVPGRLEAVQNSKGLAVFVDYAHTPDALKNVITTLRAITKGRLITVFGCGGDRDRGKRPMMGEIAASLSDVVVVTSDNPRTERPNIIIEEILPGVKKAGCRPFSASGNGYLVEENRAYAIERAVMMAKKGDVVLIAGKGHEDYQIIGKEKKHFDDREEVRKVLG